MYELIPDELKKLNNWVCWKAEPDPKSHSGITKQPINPKTGGFAKSNNPDTWSDFETAVRVSSDFAGIGFMFSNSGYFGVDIDDCPDMLTDYLNGSTASDNIISEFINGLTSYAELSQSGHGIHIICKGKLPEGSRKSQKVEMYDSGRFFVMTGNYCSEYLDITECTEKIKPLHSKYLGDKSADKPQKKSSVMVSTDVNEIIRKAMNSLNGEKFRRLYEGVFSDYPSQSEADMSFCNMLAFWCGNDTAKMDRIYRMSGLMREKWDRKQSGSTYGALTIQKAVNNCRNHYSENYRNNDYSLNFSGKSDDVKERKDYTFDDTGNAKRLFDAYGDILRWCYIEKKWLYYADGKWNYDNIGYSRKLADKVVESMEQDMKYYQLADEENKHKGNETNLEKSFGKHLTKSRSYNGKTNMIKETEHRLSILPSMFDRHKTIINCKNGMLDLKSFELSEHNKEKYITKITQCTYNPNADPPLKWLEFLYQIFDGDNDMIHYIQKAVGYALSGSTTEQCAFFLYGTGRNGKSTFLEVLRYIMGDYATNIQPQTIMVKSTSGNAPTSDIARLKGARIVTSVEPNEGMRIDEGLLKQLTGGDIVTARKMFSEEFEFKPEFKLFMATNHKPIIRGNDEGIWRRIHLIPFTVRIPDDKVDRHLKYKLAKEYEGIFKWAVDGCKMWQDEGLKMPAAMLKAVAEYQHEMDVISSFVSACCIEGEGCVKASVVYAVYAKWADSNSEYKMSSTKFGSEMAKRYEKTKAKDGLYYNGISLSDGNEYSVSIG